jgi:hypothetical protein
MTLPPFTNDGLLPTGDYDLTIAELQKSHLVVGGADKSEGWDEGWRNDLVENLGVLVCHLFAVGITEIYVDGSFVENKDHPNDIDGYFECDLKYFASGQLEADLNAIDPHKSWTWDERRRRYDKESHKRQLPMWHQYSVELYPYYGNFSGILDEFGNNQRFPAAFRKTRMRTTKSGLTMLPKGIIKIVQGR